jgi:hypothetical protein
MLLLPCRRVNHGGGAAEGRGVRGEGRPTRSGAVHASVADGMAGDSRGRAGPRLPQSGTKR